MVAARLRGRPRWGVALAVGLSLVAVVGLAPAVPAGAVPGHAAVADPVCVGEAGTAGEAAVLAAVCDVPVEVVGERTAWSSTFALPDGSVRLDSSMAAVRTDVSGVWEPVDPSLVVTDDGVQVVSAVVPMVFSDGSDGMPLVRVERDGHEVVYDAPFVLTEPVVEGARVTYPAVLPGVDLVVSVNGDATGFSQVLRVESAQAAANPALAALTFDVVTSEGVELRAEPSGGFAVTDRDGQVVLTSPVPAMWDSSTPGDGRAGRGVSASTGAVGGAIGDPTVAPAPGVEAVAMDAEIGDDAVTITPDADLLSDPATTWPVFIDPGMSGSRNQRTAVRTVIGNAYNFPDTEGVGLCNRATSNTCSHTFKSRLLYQFAGLAGLGQLDPADVQSAVFAVTGTHSYSCTPMPVTLYAVSDFDQGTSYPGGGYWQPLQTQTIAHREGCAAGLQPRRIEFDATAQARAVAAANTSVASFGLAADEDSMASWKRYAWDASFSITYNRAPLAPVNARTTGPDTGCVVGSGRPYIRSTTPTLRAVVHDPDGGNVHADFAIVSALNTNVVVWDPGPVPAQGSGAEHAIQVPAGLLHDGGQYRWLVAGLDPQGRSGPITSCEFTVDTTPPPAPSITAVPGLQATYAADTTAGGTGQPGLFRFGASGAGDVDRYEYWLMGGPTGSAPADTPQVLVTPTQVGSQTLSVRAIDRAGNTGPTATFRFTVAFAGISDAWQLDEASGTTAANVANVAAPLAVSSGVTREDGPLTSLAGLPGDRALVFDAPGDTAGTSRPVVRTDGSYSVMAMVRADQVGATATAVSQDGSALSGFELGLSTTGCGQAPSPCWSFSVPRSDSATATRAVAVASVPVRASEWVQLTGVRDAASGTVRLSVCVLGTDEIGVLEVKQGAATPAGGSWLAAGGFQVGRGKAGGAAGNPWTGAVSQVRTYTGVVSIEQLRVACTNPDSIRPVLDPAPPAPPKARNASGIDLDGNGKADVFWVSPTDGRWRVSYDGRSAWTAIGAPGNLPASWYRFGDLNGDGKDDVFLAHPDGRWLVSSGGTTGWELYGADANAAGNVKLGDLDGDGKDDVFWAHAGTGTWRVSYGGRTGWNVINNGGGFGTESFQLVDMNGDGKDDVFFAHPDGRFLVSHGGTSAWVVYGGDANAGGNVKVGDLDGDGKGDIFWANSGDGAWRVSYGGRGAWKVVNNSGGAYGTQDFQLADLDGDGKDDVFFVSPQGEWKVSYSGTSAWQTINNDGMAGKQVMVR